MELFLGQAFDPICGDILNPPDALSHGIRLMLREQPRFPPNGGPIPSVPLLAARQVSHSAPSISRNPFNSRVTIDSDVNSGGQASKYE